MNGLRGWFLDGGIYHHQQEAALYPPANNETWRQCSVSQARSSPTDCLPTAAFPTDLNCVCGDTESERVDACNNKKKLSVYTPWVSPSVDGQSRTALCSWTVGASGSSSGTQWCQFSTCSGSSVPPAHSTSQDQNKDWSTRFRDGVWLTTGRTVRHSSMTSATWQVQREAQYEL